MLEKIIVSVGDRFGRLVVLESFGETNARGARILKCRVQCDCGKVLVVVKMNMVRGSSKSCGCLERELSSKRSFRHGLTHERLYKTWYNMKSRCNNPKVKAYPDYGGRGIKVCPEWNKYPDFRAWAISAGYLDGLTIERDDNDKGYCPENCRFIPRAEQTINQRRNIIVSAFGESKVLSQWCNDPRCGLNYATLYCRKESGWSDEAIVTTPLTRLPRRHPS